MRYLRFSLSEITAADLKDRGENVVAEAFYSQGEFLNLLETDERYVDGDTLKEVNLCRLQVSVDELQTFDYCNYLSFCIHIANISKSTRTTMNSNPFSLTPYLTVTSLQTKDSSYHLWNTITFFMLKGVTLKIVGVLAHV